MAKRIIWSQRARKSRDEIFTYWNDRLKNKSYSKKLNAFFSITIQRLSDSPRIGRTLENKPNTYFLVVRDYKIFYSVHPEEIRVLYIWDTRRNPDNLTV